MIKLTKTAENFSIQPAKKIKTVKDHPDKARWYKNNVFMRFFYFLKMKFLGKSHEKLGAKNTIVSYTLARGHEVVLTKFPGWISDDEIAVALYCCLVSDNVMSGIYLGVHSPGDSDSVASIAEALLDAKYGYKSIKFKDFDKLEDHDYLRNFAGKFVRERLC
jgi:hypothetical protein